jgi:hypothetical protein
VKRVSPWLFCALALGVGGGARGESFRTLIMIDSSSSMRVTDPQKLRKVAAELYVDLARDGDLIAVAQFDGAVKDVSKGFQKITGNDVRDRLKDAIRSIGDDGEWTDFGAAFSAAGAALAAEPLAGEKRFLVFLTDGKCEPAPEEPRYLKEGEKPEKGKKAADEREARCKQYVLSQALPALKGVETAIVGLSRSAPREFLEEVARRTDGRAVVTERAEDLPHLFARIHAFNSGSRIAEANGEELTVDKHVVSLDLVVVAPKDAELAIARPDGTALSTDDRSNYYVRAERYRFFRIAKPAAGAWKIKPTRKLPAGAIAAIQNYDLHLRVEMPDHAAVGETLTVKAILAAGEGGGMPEASFLARHKFTAQVSSGGTTTTIDLAEAPDGSRVGTVVADKQGSLDIVARVDPGPEGALTRVSKVVSVQVVPPLKIAFAGPFKLGDVKPGASVERSLDLSGSEFLGEVGLEAKVEGMPVAARPKKLSLKVDEKRFDVRFEVPDDARAGALSGALVLTPVTKPYVGRAGARIPVEATVLPLSFFEQHGGKVILGALLLLVLVVVAGFKTPARFPPKLRVWYQDKPNQDEGDFGLAIRAKPGFYKAATFKIGRGGPVRRTSPLACEIVALKDGVLVRPAPGRSIKAGAETFSAPFRPTQSVKYEADEGLVFWIGREEEE